MEWIKILDLGERSIFQSPFFHQIFCCSLVPRRHISSEEKQQKILKERMMKGFVKGQLGPSCRTLVLLLCDNLTGNQYQTETRWMT